ncbi:sulfatase [Candidatus Bathyarchaeota archaeon]|nr:sulfatase [Candidatus Bathyarchaeota archaeon]
MGRPNILMIVSHDTGRHLGCYGVRVDTPNFDRMARDGVLFTNVYCTAPQCSPSRASILTGLYPHNHGLIGLTHRGFKLSTCKLLPTILAENGYQTYLFGFQHESPDPRLLGYKNIVKGKSYSCIDVTPLLLEFLKSKPEKPFFAMVGFSETHRPFPGYDGPIDSIEPLPYLPDEPDVRRDIGGLNLLVSRMDESIGCILDTLENTGLCEDTILVYTTDHGIAFPGAKATLFDPGIEVALIIRGPEPFCGGRRIDALLSNIDIMPTILDVCGIPIPSDIHGRSILPIIKGETDRIHSEVYLELTYHAAYDPIRGVRTDRYKYIRSFEWRPYLFPPNVDPSPSKEVARKYGYFDRIRPIEMLFDLDKDPIERLNLANDPDYSDILRYLRSKLHNWMKETCDQLLIQGYIPPPLDAKVTPPRSYEPHEMDPFPI